MRNVRTGKPVPEEGARTAIGIVFGLCAFLAVVAFGLSPLLAGACGMVAAAGGWLLGGLPYRIMR